jgi:hypothetical protein
MVAISYMKIFLQVSLHGSVPGGNPISTSGEFKKFGLLARPANGLGENGLDGLGYQMGLVWMGENGLVSYRVGWIGLEWVHSTG